MNNQNPMMGGPGPSQGCFQPFRNNYNNNPIGALQERFHRNSGPSWGGNQGFSGAGAGGEFCKNSNFEPLGPSKNIDNSDDVEELGFGVYKADENGEFEQVGFGQPKFTIGSFDEISEFGDKSDFGSFSDDCLEDSDGFQSHQTGGLEQNSGGFGSFQDGPDPRGHYGPPGHFEPPMGHFEPLRGHFGPPRGHFGPPRGHFGPQRGHFGPPRGPFGPSRGHVGPPRGAFEPPVRGWGVTRGGFRPQYEPPVAAREDFKVPRGFPGRRPRKGTRGKRAPVPPLGVGAGVSLPNGLVAIGNAANKKTAKHNAARGMLDILDGRASNVSSEVSQSITDGLKALRGDRPSPGPSPGHKTFSPKLIMNENQMRFIQNQKKQQEELLKQQLQYGPLGVKLWFSGEEKNIDLGGPSIQEQPNRAPPEPAGPTDDEKLEKAHQSEFYIKDPLHEESLEEYLEKLILNSVFKEISRRPKPSDLDIDRLLKNTKSDPSGGAQADSICKMCNLVFRHPGDCEEHKATTDHLHVVKGYFPGEGGYHCFLCWVSFQQAEGLLNHISRANHQARCKKKGVLRVWMEPVANKSWDLLNVHKHIKDMKTERSRDKRSRSRERKRSRSRDKRKRSSRERDLRDTMGGSRSDQHDDRGSRKEGRRSSPDRWSHDKYQGSSRGTSGGKAKSGQFEWKEVKEEDRSKDRQREDHRSRSSHHSESRSRDLPRREKSSSKGHNRESRSRDLPARDKSSSKGHRSKDHLPEREKSSSKVDLRDSLSSHQRREKSNSTAVHRKERSSSVQYDVNLYGDHEDPRSASVSRQRLSESSETSRRGKRSRRMTGSDHEEVNEIQDDFEIDSVGKIENSEETLQKMKSAIIGILDEEISTLSKKMKK